jgi:hypothetical protein
LKFQGQKKGKKKKGLNEITPMRPAFLGLHVLEMAEQLAPLERLSQEELWKVANELDLRGLARLARCSKALRAALCPRPEAWRGALRTVAGKSAVHDAPDPRRAAKAVVTLGEARWARINPGLQYDPTAPAPREQFVAFLCHGGKTLVVFGGLVTAPPRLHAGELGFTSECWALDLDTAEWTLASHTQAFSGASNRPVPLPGDRPAPRSFGADGGGGGILTSSDGHEWMVVHGGLRADGFRDNETWVLGPLGAAAGAGSWRWAEVQADGRPQSPDRPQPRFHHSLTVVGNRLVVIGGHDHTIRPILAPYALSLDALSCVSAQPEPSDRRADGEGGDAGAEAAAAAKPSQAPAAAAVITITGIESAAWIPLAQAELHSTDKGRRPPEPAARAHHSAVALSDGRLVIFGGEKLLPMHSSEAVLSLGA